ncbi:MAG TPA: protein arginine kinase [Phycisphaerae bacterium]|nr:protein arginine kinase [Phycisphaerae bacterium]HRW51746.1 protein arginine kinase [Phycisphaerae bacterium]
MTINQIMSKPGCWLGAGGPLSDIVISSRIRLARNVNGFPFLSRATHTQRSELAGFLKERLESSSFRPEFTYIDVDSLDELGCQVLVERHLVSRQLVEAKGARGVSVSENQNTVVMVNEEDHLRMHVVRAGMQLDEIWSAIDKLDDAIESQVDYAFHPRYGYLTACPTNVGTGIRVSVMLHLPALKLTGEIERVLRAAKDMNLAVRGLFGEGTEATGDFFQVSNQVTLGRAEKEIVSEFRSTIVPRIVDYERMARQALLDEKSRALDDRIYRSYGTLRHARTISSEETLLHLSHIRLGVHIGRIKDIPIEVLNELFLETQPAHLQNAHGGKLTGEQRSAARADLIRRKLGCA